MVHLAEEGTDIATSRVVTKGNANYVLAPKEWPPGTRVRLLRLHDAEAST